jgi:hypothetical protein
MRPIFITGHSRSGTSLTAGLLASQGVWFGPCNEAASINPKGFFESKFVKESIRSKNWANFAERWDNWRSEHGASEVWGVKTGPEYYQLFAKYNPLVVCTNRDEADIIDSRRRAGFKNAKSAMRKASMWMEKLPSDRITVRPDDFIKGNFDCIDKILSVIGLPFKQSAAEEWVDPSLWGGKNQIGR